MISLMRCFVMIVSLLQGGVVKAAQQAQQPTLMFMFVVVVSFFVHLLFKGNKF